MSTILKALRRLEEEKRSGEERPLREEVAAAAARVQTSRGPTGLALGLMGVGVLAVGVLAVAVWVWSPGAEPTASPADVAAAQLAPPAPPTAPERPAERPPRQAALEPAPPAFPGDSLSDEALASPVEVVPRPAVQPRVPIEIARAAEAAPPAPAPVAPRPRPAPAPAPERVAPTPALAPPVERVAPEPTRPVERVAPEPTPAPAPVVARSEPPAPAPVVAPSEPPAPAPEPVAARPAAAPVDVPDVSVERTLWHPSASRRAAFVALEGQPATRVAEGDVVGRYVVSEIRPSGVVFLHDGKPTERKVGAR